MGPVPREILNIAQQTRYALPTAHSRETAAMETRAAHRVKVNKRRGAVEDDDDDVVEEWEQDELRELCDFEADGWEKKVEDSKPNVEIDMATNECRKLRGEVEELKDMIRQLLKKQGGGGGGDDTNGS